MKDTIKYVCFYDIKDNFTQNRKYILAATNKLDYIFDTLSKDGYHVNVISSCITKNNKKYESSVKKIRNNITLKLFKTYPWGNKFNKLVSLLYQKISLFFYLIMNVSKDERIIVYHSPLYYNIVKLAKRIKGFKLILEMEEFYGDIHGTTFSIKNEKNFIKCADKYIFPTELLHQKFNVQNKPYAIIHGTYQIESDRNCKFNDDKIHVVYAGTFDPRKGGAAAAAAATWLPEKYHIHILGFGRTEDTENIKNQINEISKKSKATVTYDGLLSGEDYIQFIQKCHIGLSTQNPDASFNATSFPSKILSYMANGLRVVSIRIPAIESSAIGEDMYYYEKQTPEEIAKAIMAVDMNDGYDGRKKIAELDEQFKIDLKRLLENDIK